MKITLYIRSRKAGKVEMATRLEDEACYDTPRVSQIAHEIQDTMDKIIDDCARDGYVAYGNNKKAKMQ